MDSIFVPGTDLGGGGGNRIQRGKKSLLASAKIGIKKLFGQSYKNF